MEGINVSNEVVTQFMEAQVKLHTVILDRVENMMNGFYGFIVQVLELKHKQEMEKMQMQLHVKTKMQQN